MIDYYIILDEAHFASAVSKRFNGKVAPESEVTPAVAGSLNSSPSNT